MMIPKTHPSVLGALLAALLATLGGCDAAPRTEFVQWVVRDAWDKGCAHAATVERFAVKDKGWKEKGKVYTVTADATFKLINPCETGVRQASYPQFASVPFVAQAVEMVPCSDEGKKGWALNGLEGTRCWTGPTPPKL